MSSSQKLILLNGPAGIGKSTIAKMYLEQHPLSLSIGGDEIIGMMGQWLAFEEKARQLTFELTKSMIRTHLRNGHDVLLPYLLTHASHAQEFEELARSLDAQFIEVILFASRQDATQRLIRRGTWGEANTPPITEHDLPVIEQLYDTMAAQLEERPYTVRIDCTDGEVNDTYAQFLKAIDSSEVSSQ